MQIKRFIVFGASGRTGRQCCKIAKKKQHEVIAVIRNPDQAPEFEKQGIKPVIFDISKATLAEYEHLYHTHRPDVVIWAAGTSEDSLGRVIDYQAQVNVYDAMKAGGVRRVLVVGSIGIWKEGTDWPDWYDEEARCMIMFDTESIERRVGRIRELVPTIVEAKWEAEHHLRALKHLHYTIIRPGGLTNEPAEGARLGKVGVGLTSRELVAQLVIACTNQPGMYGRTIDVVDGTSSVPDEILKVIKQDIDTWVGE